jgi:hypothetical protein
MLSNAITKYQNFRNDHFFKVPAIQDNTFKTPCYQNFYRIDDHHIALLYTYNYSQNFLSKNILIVHFKQY